jgi:hypothetical protein
MADGWHWAAAGLVAVLLIILVLLWYDTLRERPGWTIRRATLRALPSVLTIPIGCALALFLPLWVGGVLIAVLLLIIGAMALAD